jgi:hypothetical protein
LASSFFCFQAESTPAHTQVTQTVGLFLAQQIVCAYKKFHIEVKLMGLVLGIETETGQEIPYSGDGILSLKHSLLTFGIQDEPLTKIANQFEINLESLTGDKIVGREDETLENFMSRDPDDKDRAKYWYESQATREAAWQSPQTIINAIVPLVKVLDTHSNMFSDLEIDDRYFTSGYFRKDLETMTKALEWCIENNIKKVRITIG